MRKVVATRYVAPLREGGSLPALVEADDDGLYVLKCTSEQREACVRCFAARLQAPRRFVEEAIRARSVHV